MVFKGLRPAFGLGNTDAKTNLFDRNTCVLPKDPSITMHSHSALDTFKLYTHSPIDPNSTQNFRFPPNFLAALESLLTRCYGRTLPGGVFKFVGDKSKHLVCVNNPQSRSFGMMEMPGQPSGPGGPTASQRPPSASYGSSTGSGGPSMMGSGSPSMMGSGGLSMMGIGSPSMMRSGGPSMLSSGNRQMSSGRSTADVMSKLQSMQSAMSPTTGGLTSALRSTMASQNVQSSILSVNGQGGDFVQSSGSMGVSSFKDPAVGAEMPS